MVIQYQSINEELAKGIKSEYIYPEISREIENANAFLLKNQGIKPEWIDSFFESNKCKLVETICRAISGADGITSLRGYSEGYFNEIIQNADDLHFGKEIDISVKKNGNTCSITCVYPDKGFGLSNIYGFLNREMSDKSSENGQTGKFGVGIKSFFKFVNSLHLESNVKFLFDITREQSDVQVIGNVGLNPQWDKKTTKLMFEYDSRRECGFNSNKLTALVDYFVGNSVTDINKFFVTGEDNEMIFDIRSLIFMQINGWKKEKVSISKLSFSGARHRVEISCENSITPNSMKIGTESWTLFDLMLSVSLDGRHTFEQEYIIFGHDEISFGFPINNLLEENNRIYSTYYIKTDVQGQIRPLSMLVDSKYSNIHRNDVGDSEESIKKVYETIKNRMLMLYMCMCSKEASIAECRTKISDIFHSVLIRYLYADSRVFTESPLNCYGLDNGLLPKTSEEVKRFIVVHDTKEKYEAATYLERDIVRELKESYLDYIERKDVFDYQKLIDSASCIFGVKRLYQLLNVKCQDSGMEYDDNIKKIAEIANYFSEVRDYLSYVICGERRWNPYVTDAEIDCWLIDLETEIGKYYNPQIFMKLIGKYKLNTAIDIDGTVKSSNLSFKDYLFNGAFEEKGGILSELQNKQFDEKYSGLKRELLKKRYIDAGNKQNPYAIRCIHPNGRSLNNWDGKFDYYQFSGYQISDDPLSEPELFLEKLANDRSFEGMLYSQSLRLFEKKAGGLWRRERPFKYSYVIEQQIIDISCITRITCTGFSNFIEAIKYRKQLREDLAEQIHLSCTQQEITTQNIAEYLLPLMIETQEGEKKAYLLDEFDPDAVEIVKIVETTNNEAPKENREFVAKITGYNIHLYHFESNTRRKIIAFCGKGTIAIRTDASKEFRKVAKYSADEKDVYIFYDNFGNDAQDAIALVLDGIGISKKTVELLQGYIHNGNHTKTMNYLSRKRSLAKVKRKLVLDWCNIGGDDVSAIYDNEVLYRLLTARGSYDIFCPICADIPFETFDYGEDTKRKHSRKIIILENDNPCTCDEVPYIVTVACSYCFEKLRNTLSESEFDGKYLTLTTQIAHGQHEKMKSKRQIELSPINIELMKKFKMC